MDTVNNKEIIVIEPTEIESINQIDGDLYTRFIEYLDAKPNTLRTYKTSLKQFFIYLQENGITNPKRSDIIAYRDSLKEEKKKATTIQNYITAVKLFFQWAEVEGLYKDIAKHVKGAKISRDHKKDYLTTGQLQEILKEIDRSTQAGKRDYALFLLMVTGGLRDIEVHRANIGDLRTLGDTAVLYIQGKGKDEKEDYIKVTTTTEKAVREYLNTRKPIVEEDPLFISHSNNSKGNRLSTRSISGIAKNCMIQAGYDSSRLTAHSLRHTAVTLSLIGGNTLQEVQQFARHQNISTTQIYAHNLERLDNKCENTIENAIFNN